MSSNQQLLEGVAVVTGAGSGIGRATAKLMVAKGVSAITLVDVNEAGLKETEADIKKANPQAKTLIAVVDLTDEASVIKFHKQTVDAFGRIDYAVNSAGIVGQIIPFTEVQTEQWDKVVNINQRALFFCVREQLRVMKAQERRPDRVPGRGQAGSIVSAASVLGLKGAAAIPAYVTSKHGVVGLAKAAMHDAAKYGIRVNNVAPGYITTPLTANPTAKIMTQEQFTPMAREGMPEEIADVVVFLLSEQASYVNGVTWNVDGGFLG